MPEVINIFTPVTDFFSSYGLLACVLAREFTARGIYVNVLTPNGQDVHETQPDDIRALCRQSIEPAVGGILLGYPTQYYKYGRAADRGCRIAITMFESTRLPDAEWIRELNTCDGIVSPSGFVSTLLRSHGVTTPIATVPLGVSAEYQYRPRSASTVFTFLAIGDRGGRKGWDLAGRAFCRAFGDDPRYRLIIKRRPSSPVVNITNPNISLWSAEMDLKGLSWLYGMVDCLVFPSRGEGFGLPPREFAATGGMVLATDWSGLSDYIDEYADPIKDFQMVPAWPDHPLFAERCGEWAEVNVDTLADMMRRVAVMDVEQRNEVGYRRSILTLRRNSWSVFAERVLQVYHEQQDDGGHSDVVSE